MQGRIAAAQRRLAGAVPVNLPFDRPVPHEATTRLHHGAVPMGDAVWSAVRELARAESTTEFVVLSAALKAFLSALTGQSDIVTNVPSRLARGVDPALASVFGVFGDYLMLRTRLGSGVTFRELVRQEHVIVDEAQRDADLPSVVVMGEAQGPLWRVVLNMIIGVTDQPSITALSGLTAEPVGPPGKHKGYYDLTWGVWTKDGPTDIFASGDQFDESTVRQLAAELGAHLRILLSSPDTPCAGVRTVST
jgi:non-ribosomal peptide synthetase component F